MEEHATALYVFRKLVYVLYLEIGSLRTNIHPGIAKKAHMKTAFFEREKERQALDLYRQIENETNVEKILIPFIDRTGLKLEDIHRAFVEGNWKNKFGGYNFGGPKWAKIAEVAVAMQKSLEQNDWAAVDELVQEVKGLKTNQGFLVSQFERTDRRRR